MTLDSLNEFLDSPLGEALRALVILLVFGLAAWLVSLISGVALRRLSRRHRNAIGAATLGAVRTPVLTFLVLQGLFLALVTISYLDKWRDEIGTGWAVLVVLTLAYGAANAAGALMSWYSRVVAPLTRTQFDDKVVPILGRVVRVGVYGIASLVVLDKLGYSISPILGGLGITGLAMALALQPTLSNFFAGTYVISDGAISVGDYIELQGGPAGYVIEVGWRSTRIRSFMNNLVIIPNSRLADTIVTNYNGPVFAMNVIVYGGVSYSSDLDLVERVSKEVAAEVLATSTGSVRGFEPWFGFENFGESNITFWLFVQAKDRIGSFVVQHELVKGLHARFKEEGIEINYPVRKLVFPESDGPGEPPLVRGQAGQNRRRARRTVDGEAPPP